MALTGQERQARYRAKSHTTGKRLKSLKRDLPFVGIDGEGANTDEYGRQLYLLLRAGDAEMYDADKMLTTEACLSFLCDLPRDRIYVGFSFGYDVTMILRDLPPAKVARLFMTEDTKRDGGYLFRYVYFGKFAVEYLPRQYFRVARVDPRTNKVIPYSSRTIWEVFGFFQCSFLKALQQFEIGREHWEEIETNKARRGEFIGMTEVERHYCKLECELLAQLMETFREVCIAGDIVPRTWNGAGKLAASLHTAHKTIRKGELVIPSEVMQMARDAYYGGRFEITHTGEIDGPIHEHDIRSAYPAAMLRLPCLRHGRWSKGVQLRDRSEGVGGIWIAAASFKHNLRSRLCGLPIRNREGRLFWPRQGNGVYWSCEIEAARNIGASVNCSEGWQYHCDCDCSPFKWVGDLYNFRRSIGSSARGYPIKLGINALYGQLARRIGGGGPWQNHAWAGLITALTRAKLLEAIRQAPDDIVMLATDAVYSRVPLRLETGDELGQWEHAEHPRMFIVQPGLYWGPPKPKTRGVPRGFFTNHTQDFETAWRDYMEYQHAAVRGRNYPIPAVSLPLTNFTGIRLAHSRGKPLTAGRWTNDERKISFDWTAKRVGGVPVGNAIRTDPHPGASDLVSMCYAWTDESVSMAQEMETLTEGMPDHMDFSAPGF